MEPKKIGGSSDESTVLCKLVPGLEQEALRSIRDIEGVTEVYLVFGGWDAVLQVEADTMDKSQRDDRVQNPPDQGRVRPETLVTASLVKLRPAYNRRCFEAHL